MTTAALVVDDFGNFELVEQDCSETEQTCVLFSGGAACGTPPNTLSGPTSKRSAGNIARDAVSNAFFYDPQVSE